jgi:hypothetical protein
MAKIRSARRTASRAALTHGLNGVRRLALEIAGFTRMYGISSAVATAGP